MADPFAPASENPFDQIDPDMAAPVPQSAGPEAQPLPQDNKPAANPFDDLGEVGPGPSSKVGAFARGAEKSVIPSLVSFPAMGAGAEAGAAIGAVGGPIGAAVGGVTGALVAGFGASTAASYAQNWALKKLPDAWQDKLGVDDRQARLDEAQHPVASFLGGLAPFAVTMRPGGGAMKDLPENATALQRIMANPVTARLFGGAAMGGMELGTEAATQEHLDWRKVAISTAFGMVFNKPNKVGEAITEIGAHPARAALGRPHPTVAEAADLKVMGPGVTEGVFHGTQEQSPSAAMTAQENARVERTLLGEPPEPDLHDIARRMEPETFERYDELQKQREIFSAWHGEGPGHAQAEKHLAATDAEIAQMGPTIAAAYRRAQDTVGVAGLEPEPFPSFAAMLAAHETGTGRQPNAPAQAAEAVEAAPGGGSGVPAGGEAPNPVVGGGAVADAGVPGAERTIGAQRAFIANDVTQKLIAAGRPPEEAAAAGQLLAARFVTRAGRFEGKLGSAEELYAREGAAIAGPDGRPLEPAAPPPRQVIAEYAKAGETHHEAAQAPVAPEIVERSTPGVIASDFDAADRIKNEWRRAAPFKDTDAFIQASLPNQETLAKVGDQIAAELGIPHQNPGVKAVPGVEKSRARLDKKALKHGIGGVTDQVRTGLDVQTPAQADRAVEILGQHFPVVDEGWQTTIGGYFDRKVYVRFPDGMIGEVQMWPPGMFDAKEHRGGHGLYDGVRELPPWHPLIPQFLKVGEELYSGVRAALSPEWKAVLGSDGSLPNRLPNASAESSVASDASAALISDQRPPEKTQASEPLLNTGSPSSEPAFSFDMGGTPSENIGPHSEPVNAGFDAAAKINSLTPAEQKRELPKYTQSAEQAPKGRDQPAGVFMFDPTALDVDAQRFQFKSGGDEYGVTGALRSVTKWDPAKAQAIIVWEQADGKLFVADGHQRAGLARRLTEKGGAKGIELPGILYREKDGVSAGDIKSIAAVTNIANGSGSALDGAKILRARPDLMDGSLPLSVGKGKQAAALARLGDEPFRMVLNEVIPEHYGAVVGELIPHDAVRQEAAIKAIARFEPKNADEAAVLTQRVAQAELAKAEAGAQSSMFGDLETAESTAGEEMKIVGRAIADLKKDKGLFARVLANAERIEQTGSQIKREAAQSVASDSEVFAKTLTSNAYSAGPIRDELIAAARDLKNGKATIGDATGRILDALRREAETHGADRAGDIGRVEPKEYAQTDQLDFEAGAEGKPQSLIPGVAPVTQRDLIQAAANKPLKPKVAQKSVGGLFGDSMDQKELFQAAYHGSPYHFDMFDTAHIGSGEGAAAYGHGLYFAENEKVAQEYRDALKGKVSNPRRNEMMRVLAHQMSEYEIPGKYRQYSDPRGYELAKQYDALMEERAADQGHLYRVNIKPEPHEFLPWDKPVTDQAMLDKVKAAADKIKPGWYERLMGEGKDLAKWSLARADTTKTGQEIYGTLKRGLGSDKAASEALRDAGVPGIRYMDQGSRIPVAKLDGKPIPSGSSAASLAAEKLELHGSKEGALASLNRDAKGHPFIQAMSKEAAELISSGRVTREAPENATHNYVVFDPKHIEILDRNGKPVSEAEFNQTARGKIRIAEGRRPIITLMKDANPSTFIHESGHQFLEELMHDADHPEAPMGLRDDAQTVRDWLGVTDDIKTKHHEKFARGFEQYLREGVAPSPELAGVFAKFRNWLLSVYQSIKGLGTEISPEIRGVFDRLLEMEPQRTVVVPERQSPTLLHDIHEAEAQHIEPHEAEGAMDRVAAERDRYIAEQPPEIQRGLETAIAKDTAAQAAAAGTEGGAGAGGPSEVVADRGGPVAEPGGGGGGAESGTVKPGSGSAGAESAGVQRPDPRSKLGNDAGTALAPGPADLFGARESPFTDRAGNIRLDTLNTSEDVKRAIRDSAAENNDFIGDRRGEVTDGQVYELANEIGMSGAEELVGKHVAGQAFNAEQVVALRKLLRESAGNVSVAAKKVAETGADADVLAYAQAKDRLQMVQKTVAGVTAEAGRALRAFRTLPGEADTKALEQMIAEATGKTLFQLKREAVLVSALDTPQKINKFAQGNYSYGAMLLEYWINGLLYGLGTHVTNTVSNELMAFMHHGPEKATAALIGHMARGLGREGTYTRFGEMGAAIRGTVEGLAPAIESSAESFKRGASSLLPGEEHPVSGVLQGILHDDMVSRATLNPDTTMRDVGAAGFGLARGIQESIVSTAALVAAGGAKGSPAMNLRYSPYGAIPDVEVRGITIPIGAAARLPGRFLATMDTFTRSLNYTASLNSIAYRMASDENLMGMAFAKRVAEIKNNPPPHVMEEARGTATELTFMDKAGELAQRLNRLANWEPSVPGLGATRPLKFVMPFINVVSRILDQTLVKRTPLGFLSPELRADLSGKNGNIAQDTAAGRMILSSALLLGYGALAAKDYITGSGPKDPKENAVWRLTHQPHSIKIGNMWYGVQKLGPQGMLMGMAADLHDIHHLAQEDKWAEAGSMLLHAIVQNVLDQSAFQGPADAIKAVETPDQYGPQFIKSFLSSFVPASGLERSIVRMRDPYMRQTWGIIDAIKASVPGYSETLHPKRDLWGEPVPTRDALFGPGLSTLYLQKVNSDPVNVAMNKLGLKTSSVEKKIRNVELSPEQYDDYARIAGRMTKMRLDAIVRSSAYETWPDHIKHDVFEETIKQCREVARGQVMMKDPSLVRAVVEAQKAKARGEKKK